MLIVKPVMPSDMPVGSFLVALRGVERITHYNLAEGEDGSRIVPLSITGDPDDFLLLQRGWKTDAKLKNDIFGLMTKAPMDHFSEGSPIWIKCQIREKFTLRREPELIVSPLSQEEIDESGRCGLLIQNRTDLVRSVGSEDRKGIFLRSDDDVMTGGLYQELVDGGLGKSYLGPASPIYLPYRYEDGFTRFTLKGPSLNPAGVQHHFRT